MSDRDPDPSSSPAVEPTPPSPSRAKVRVLLPLALSVAALAVFLIAFWPSSHAGKKGHARRDHDSVRGSSPVGGSRGNELGDLGNASVTKEGKGPVGGAAPARSRSKGDGWWYQDKGKSSQSGNDQWWYQEGKGSGKAGNASEAAEKAPEGREQEAKAVGKSGPDNDWWHD